MGERPAEPDIWIEQIAPMLLGLVVSIPTQRIASLAWPAQLGIAGVVGFAWWWLIRTRLRRRRATHPEAMLSGQPGAAGAPVMAELPGPAQPPGAPPMRWMLTERGSCPRSPCRYRTRGTYRVRPVAWSGAPGQRRPVRLETRWTQVSQATEEALAQRCTKTTSVETLANARRAG